MESRNQALNKAELIWESSDHLRDQIVQDKLREERSTKGMVHLDDDYVYHIDMLSHSHQYKLKIIKDEIQSTGGILDHINSLWRTEER